MGSTRLRRVVARLALAWLLVCVALPIYQCVMVRFVTPPLTLTMTGAMHRHWKETGDLAWREQRPVSLDDLPPTLPRFAVTAEDQMFFEHHGFDWYAITQALEHNRDGGKLRGGSTISQQVARNAFLWQDRSWLRKGLEAWYTVWLEAIVPKERILELYLNIAQTGPLQFGVEAGARHWFDEPAADLSRDQAARLISLLPAPSSWTPTSATVSKHALWIREHEMKLAWEEGYAPPRRK